MKKIFSKKIVMLPLLALICSLSFAFQPRADWMNIGSAKKLSGKTYVLLMFCSYQGSSWIQSDIDKVVQVTYEACNWLTKAAASYGKSATFDIYSLGNDGNKITFYPAPYSTTAIDDAMTAAGNNPATFDFEQWVKSEYDYDNVLVLVCSNSCGRCFANNYTMELAQYDQRYKGVAKKLEGAVVYQCFSDGSFVLPSTIAHEVLHTYGAWDLYSVYNNQQLEQLYTQYFPTSIMHQVPYNINDAEMDYLTAYLVGLTDKYESWYESFSQY